MGSLIVLNRQVTKSNECGLKKTSEEHRCKDWESIRKICVFTFEHDEVYKEKRHGKGNSDGRERKKYMKPEYYSE